VLVRGLRAVQKRATAVVAGAFRTTAADALDIELDVLPIRHQLYRRGGHALLRLKLNRPYMQLLRESRYFGLRRTAFKSPLQRLEEYWADTLAPRTRGEDKLEEVTPFTTEPWAAPPDVAIATSAEAATRAHDIALCSNGSDTMMIYTDGSGHGGHIGAGAHAPAHPWPAGRITGIIDPYRRPDLDETVYLGPEAAATVYVAELRGIAAALELARRQARMPWSRRLRAVQIYADNQAALRTIDNPGRRPGQYMVKRVLALAKDLQEDGIAVHMAWIPAHVGVPGNEAADKLAKAGATPDRPHHVGHTVWGATGRKAAIDARIDAAWDAEWRAAKHGRALHRLQAAHSADVLKLHSGLRKAESAVLVQARTGKIWLAKHRFDIARAETPWCPRCWTDRVVRTAETVRHVLTECPSFDHLRGRLFRNGPQDVKALLADPARAKDVATFFLRTGILGQFRHVTQPPGRPPE
jgi:ribonuclease HI